MRNSLLRRLAGATDASLPEEMLEAGASEKCRAERVVECATFFARWKHDHPDSPRLADALAEARSRERAGAALADGALDGLVDLFDDPGRLPKLRSPLARARQTSQRFVLHFQHAIPFDRRALEAVWRDCRNEACAVVQKQVEETLGPLGRH
jgi:hypothetical protein